MPSTVPHRSVAAVSGALLLSTGLLTAPSLHAVTTGVTTSNGQLVANLTGVVVNEVATGVNNTFALAPSVNENFGGGTVTAALQATINDAVFRGPLTVGSTGSGTYTRMYNVGSGGNGATNVDGYNFWGTGKAPMDIGNTGGTFQPQLRLSQIPVVTFDSGLQYFKFALDTNQGNSTPQRYISLDQVIIFTGPANTTSATTPKITANDGSVGLNLTMPTDHNIRYQMRTSSQQATVLVDSYTSAGSGLDDMNLYVPISMFATEAATGYANYVYLYSNFGNFTGTSGVTGRVNQVAGTTVNFTDNGGFEEWALPPSTTFVPEPSTYALGFGGFALVGAALIRRRKAA